MSIQVWINPSAGHFTQDRAEFGTDRLIAFGHDDPKKATGRPKTQLTDSNLRRDARKANTREKTYSTGHWHAPHPLCSFPYERLPCEMELKLGQFRSGSISGVGQFAEWVAFSEWVNFSDWVNSGVGQFHCWLFFTQDLK